MMMPAQFKDRAEVQQFLDKVVRYKWFRQRWPRVTEVRVTARARTRATANIWGRAINLPNPKTKRWAYHADTVVHELAHICAGEDCASHGPRFYRTDIFLTEKLLGPEAAAKHRKWIVEVLQQSLAGEVARWEDGPLVKDPPPLPKPEPLPTKKSMDELAVRARKLIRDNEMAELMRLCTDLGTRAAKRRTAAMKRR
jgi:putative metallohydrolase (TIGR04338 family)